MTSLTLYLSGAASVVLLALCVALFLRGPLRSLLAELCETERRAGFWVAFWIVAVVLTTTFGVLSPLPPAGSALWKEAPELRTFLATLRAGLFGIMAVLGAMGIVLLIGIQAYEDRRRRVAAWASTSPASPHSPSRPTT